MIYHILLEIINIIIDIAAPARAPATALTDMINNILPDQAPTNTECLVGKSMKILRKKIVDVFQMSPLTNKSIFSTPEIVAHYTNYIQCRHTNIQTITFIQSSIGQYSIDILFICSIL